MGKAYSRGIQEMGAAEKEFAAQLGGHGACEEALQAEKESAAVAAGFLLRLDEEEGEVEEARVSDQWVMEEQERKRGRVDGNVWELVEG